MKTTPRHNAFEKLIVFGLGIDDCSIPFCRRVFVLGSICFGLTLGRVQAAEFSLTLNAGSGTRQVVGKPDNKSVTLPETVSLRAESTAKESGTSINDASWVSEGASVANGTVGPGAMVLFAQASGTTGSFKAASVGTGGASAVGRMNESFVILAPDCANCQEGRRGTMTFAVSFSGKLGGGGSAVGDITGFPNGLGHGTVNGSWNTSLSLQAGYLPGATIPSSVDLAASGTHTLHTSDGSEERTTSGLGLGIHTATVSFEFGKPISIQWLAGVSATADISSTGYERSFAGHTADEADFSNAFAWGGILSVTDDTGAGVGTFTAVNGGGVSYRDSFAPPVLDVVLNPDGRSLLLSWPSTTPRAFSLESTSASLNPDWQPVVATLVESNGRVGVTLPMMEGSSKLFFRLRR